MKYFEKWHGENNSANITYLEPYSRHNAVSYDNELESNCFTDRMIGKKSTKCLFYSLFVDQ